jgi:hypothetical protein
VLDVTRFVSRSRPPVYKKKKKLNVKGNILKKLRLNNMIKKNM